MLCGVCLSEHAEVSRSAISALSRHGDPGAWSGYRWSFASQEGEPPSVDQLQ